MKFLLPVVECYANGEQALEKGTSFRYMVLLILFIRETVDCTISQKGFGENCVLAPIGTSSKKAANTVKFVNFWNVHFVSILSLLHDSMTSVLSRKSFSFTKSSMEHTSFDQSSRVLF